MSDTDRRPGQSAEEMARAAAERAPMWTSLARVLRVHTDERAWRRGAKGEREVGRRLRQLPDSWTVLHDIQIDSGKANVDHVVLGPPGVFCLNTKCLKGNVWVGDHALLVNGHRQDFYRKALWESQWVSRTLSKAWGKPIGVSPLIVIMGAEITIKAQPEDVKVVARRKIVDWLTSYAAQSTAEELEELRRVFRDPATWSQ